MADTSETQAEPQQKAPASTFDQDHNDEIHCLLRDHDGLDFCMASTLLWAVKTLPRKEYLRILQQADEERQQHAANEPK